MTVEEIKEFVASSCSDLKGRPLINPSKDEDVEIGRIMMHEPWYELTPTWFKDGRITKQSLKERIGDAFEKEKKFIS